MHEEVSVWIFVGRGRNPTSVDAEKGTKLLVEVGLFDVSARFWRNPQFLRISCGLEIDEAERADCNDYEAHKDGGPRAGGRPFASVVESLC